ncbi:MAG: YceI family protein [Actinomycetota bacterium]
MSTETITGRQVNGVDAPLAGTWDLDPAHTSAAFVARHVLTKTRGRFTTISGAVHFEEDPLKSWVEVEIDAASIETNSADRDKHLKSADFLDIEQFPKLTFRSKEVRPKEGTEFQLVGDLTIKDVTRQVVLDADFEGVSPDPFGTTTAAFTAKGEIDREEFGMTWNVAIETGGFLVGKKVQLEIDAELHLRKDDA